MTGYVTTKRVNAVAVQLTDFDRRLIDHLRSTKLLTGLHLQRLENVQNQSQRRRLHRRLDRLQQLGVLARLDRRIGGVRAGSESYVWCFDILGQRLTDPRTGRRPRRPWTPSVRTLAHALAVSELYVRLRERERSGLFDLVSFATEPACWRNFVGPGGARMTLKPDAHTVIATDDADVHAWIEMDMATESQGWIAEKAKTYGRYFATGKEQARDGVFPKCLWIAPTERRAADLIQALVSLPPDDWQLHHVATTDKAVRALVNQYQPLIGELD